MARGLAHEPAMSGAEPWQPLKNSRPARRATRTGSMPMPGDMAVIV